MEFDNVFRKIEWAGRVCYKTEKKTTSNSYEKFIKRLINSKHYSVLEHDYLILRLEKPLSEYIVPQELKTHFYESSNNVVYANVRAWIEFVELNPLLALIDYFPIFFGHIEGRLSDKVTVFPNTYFNSSEDMIYGKRETFFITTTRILSQQIVRHRLLSISQESQRYCNYAKKRHGKNVKFIKPDFIKEDKKLSEDWVGLMEGVEEKYFEYLKLTAPENARDILPNCTATSLVITANLWEWKHIFDLRCKPEAQKNTRELMQKAKDELLKKYTGTKIEKFLKK